MDRDIVAGGRRIPCNDPKLSSLWAVESHPLVPKAAEDLRRTILILLVDTNEVAMQDSLAHAKTLQVPRGSNSYVDAKGTLLFARRSPSRDCGVTDMYNGTRLFESIVNAGLRTR
jgi:hypothetical protein